MAGTLAPPPHTRAPAAIVQPLSLADLPKLRLRGQQSSQAIRQILEFHPGRSVWSPATLEYAVLGPWRHRAEIASVAELVAVRHVEPLLREAYERCVEHGDELMIAIELESQRAPTRFERAGLELLEEVITYEADIPRAAWRAHHAVRLIPVRASDGRAVESLARLDRAAFPWLWRNSRTELDVYLRTPGVEVALIEAAGEPVAYIGVTHFAGWSHLDRIAVAPQQQGRGLGREALGLALDAMRRQGALRAALSTQRTNRRSQRLYARFGFQRTFDNDYRLYGRWCRPDSAAPFDIA